jgi:hypothetical protein
MKYNLTLLTLLMFGIATAGFAQTTATPPTGEPTNAKEADAQKAKAQQPTPADFPGRIGKTLADSKEVWPQNPKAPEGAPNVIWALLDDVGFGATSAFGGLIHTPNFDALACVHYSLMHRVISCDVCRMKYTVDGNKLILIYMNFLSKALVDALHTRRHS